MTAENPRADATDSHALGVSLGPTLRQVCSGRLSEIEWFRASWQRGSAATGFATWTTDAGDARPAMVKLPVGPSEHSWTMRLGALDPDDWDSPAALALPTPRVFAAGEALGGYDLAWLVVERFEGKPLSLDVLAENVSDLLKTVALFYAHAQRIRPVETPVSRTDWPELLDKSRVAIRDHAMADNQRWSNAVKAVQKRLSALLAQWQARPINVWCHGDLHLGNAMRRHDRCVLIDLALVHSGCWVEDAVYLERQFWGRAGAIKPVKPIALLARNCRAQGVDTAFDYSRVADIRRVLMAACVPVFLGWEGSPEYVSAALETLERASKKVLR
ncbi:MAG: aminoglycoside phosphotransferase family protein [Planctomycetes bacterium]|nr:aminoglycoside phosphotransferase family protein [Planctomycetota bacterium]